mmetsp:Transcript_146852/g.471506  ORF Transcript_146852/g.471506 Transcript_146852/m.471506 type:complete len:201 (+) Transcript_146852:163-765(+)
MDEFIISLRVTAMCVFAYAAGSYSGNADTALSVFAYAAGFYFGNVCLAIEGGSNVDVEYPREQPIARKSFALDSIYPGGLCEARMCSSPRRAGWMPPSFSVAAACFRWLCVLLLRLRSHGRQVFLQEHLEIRGLHCWHHDGYCAGARPRTSVSLELQSCAPEPVLRVSALRCGYEHMRGICKCSRHTMGLGHLPRARRRQ